MELNVECLSHTSTVITITVTKSDFSASRHSSTHWHYLTQDMGVAEDGPKSSGSKIESNVQEAMNCLMGALKALPSPRIAGSSTNTQQALRAVVT